MRKGRISQLIVSLLLCIIMHKSKIEAYQPIYVYKQPPVSREQSLQMSPHTIVIAIPIGLCRGCEVKLVKATATIVNPYTILYTICTTCHAERVFIIFYKEIANATMQQSIQNRQCVIFDRILFVAPSDASFIRPSSHINAKLIPYKKKGADNGLEKQEHDHNQASLTITTTPQMQTSGLLEEKEIE